jgi:hypothetical protein
MEENKKFVIQIFDDTEAEWLDSEEGQYSYTDETFGKVLAQTITKLDTWKNSVPDLEARIVSRVEQVIAQ